MKKIIYAIFIVFLILKINALLFGQSVEKEWILYPNSVNLNLPTPVVSLLPGAPPDYNGEYTDANGAFNSEGDLLFYLLDEDVFNSLGELVGELEDPDPDYAMPIRETNIVPVPDNDNKFYILFSKGRVHEGQNVLYATIDCSGGNCVIENNGTLLNHYQFGNNNGITVSRLYYDNTRRMYLAINDFVKRYEINSDGIFFQENIMVYPNEYGLFSWDFDAIQLELSNDCSKLVWGSSIQNGVELPYIHIIELNEAGSFENYYAVLVSDSEFEPTWNHNLKGVEISSDNSKVYVSVSDGDQTGGIFCYNFESSVLTNIIYDEYNISHLQSDANGFIYAISNDKTNLGRIDPNTNTFTPSYLVLDIFSDHDAGGIICTSLPDLIDYNSIMALSATSTYESCASESDGTATVTVSGGVPPYTYLWDDPLAQTTPTAVNLAPGIYTCIVTDAFNTSISIIVEIVTDPVLFTHIGDWEVYTLDGINGFAAIDGTIEIFDGGTFMIDGNIEFNENSGIIVHNGGTLYIFENSVLSGLTACNNNFWAGVSLEEQGILLADIDHFTISKGNLIIEPGAQVSFLANTVYFESNIVIVKQGGELVLNNNTLTSVTGKTWQGIQVWGNKYESQQPLPGELCAQGKLILKNGATIENAIVAVDLWNPDVWSTTGGIVYADGAIFSNNAKSVHALHYRNFNPNFPDVEWDYFSSFKNCTFEITENYLGDVTFYKHVDLSHVRGIDFVVCDFSLAANVADVSEWNSGIASYGAGFKLKPRCTSNTQPCQEYESCTFAGFYSAVNASSEDFTPYTFSIVETDFNNNIYGVKVNNVDNASILSSNFYVGENTSSDKNICFYAPGVGIYISEATGFAIEDNRFYKQPGAPNGNYYGVVISNSRATDEIYKNYFTGLSYANFSEGQNWGKNRYTGLTYFCNKNADNYADFFVADDEDGLSGIQSEQGDDNNVTGNTFTQNGARWHFYNGGSHLVGYYYCDDCPDEQPDLELLNQVTDKEKDIENNCPPHYGGGGHELVLNTQQKLNAGQVYNSNLSDYNSVKALYDGLVDGGDTDAELLDIQTAQPEDMLDLKAQLLSHSPHLSMEVLKATADKTNVFTEAALFDILSANPDELKKEELIKYLEEKEDPLPDSMIVILRNVATGTTYKTVLQQQMASYNRELTRAAHDIIRSNLNDTVADYNELRDWLDNLGGITSDRQIIATYVHEGNFTEAHALANLLPGLYNLEGDELTEHNYYIDMLDMYETLYLQGRNTYELDSTEFANLETMADSSAGVAGAQAKSILEAVYGRHFYNCPDTEGAGAYKSGKVTIDGLSRIYGLDISVKPNPAGQWATFDYTLPEGETNATIIITDIAGKAIETLSVSGRQGQKLWDTHQIEQGMYLYTLKAAGMIKSGKIIVSR